MANQANFPDIYIDGTTGGDGSLASPYASFSEINWTTGGDNSVTDYYAGDPAASVKIHFKRGETWREFCNIGASGTATYPIYLTDYDSGALPLFLGSILISDGAVYKWTATANWTSSYKEYGLEALAGGAPGISEPNQVHIDDVRCSTYNVILEAAESIGSLSDHAFAWADPGFGFPTVVIRDESGDPDVTGAVIEASNAANNWVFYLDEDNIICENLDVRHSNGHAFRMVGGVDNVRVQDCTTKYNFSAGVQVYSSTNCVISGNDLSHSTGANINVNGSTGNKVLGLLIENNDVHDADVNYGAFNEASGFKGFCMDSSIVRRNSWYNNLSGGLRLDGLAGVDGCDSNEIYENEFYNNGGINGAIYAQMELEYSSDNLIYLNYFHDPWEGGCNLSLSHSYSDRNHVFSNIFVGAYANHWKGNIINHNNAGDTEGDQNLYYNNLIVGAYMGFNISSGPWTVLRNNIVVDSLGRDLRFSDDTFLTTFDSDYNCFTGDGVNGVVRIEYDSYTLSEWVALTTTAGNTCDANSIEDDPLLTDPDGEDFSLQVGSPCIGVAEVLNAEYGIGFLPGSLLPPDVATTGERDSY